MLYSLSGIDPSAVRALKRLFLRVGPIVPGQMFRLGKLLGAYRTHAFLLGRLGSPATHESRESTGLHYHPPKEVILGQL